MKLAIFGAGYVGLVTGVCFADLGNDVICVDVDPKKVESLNKGKVTIYEVGLEELLAKGLKEKRLTFTTGAKAAIEGSEVIFICVGTPPKHNGEADLTFVTEVAKTIAEHMNSYKVVVNKSTVPVGTADYVRRVIKANAKHPFDVVSNPEFLREGAAVKDFQNPDRVIVGTESEKAQEILKKLYSPVARVGRPIVFTTIKSAELIKYASNAMLATRISFMNELSFLCEEVGADIKQVAHGMGLDTRIGPRFLQAGAGYGGSCLDGSELVIIKKGSTIRPIKIEELQSLKTKGLKLASLNFKKRQICFRSITSITRRMYRGNIIRVVTSMNKTLNATDDHPFLVYENNSFKTKLARELSLKDMLPSMSNLPQAQRDNGFIDLIGALDKRLFDFSKVRIRPKRLSFKKFEPKLSQKFKAARLRDILRSNCMNLKEYLGNGVEKLVPRASLLLFTAKGTPSYVPAVIPIDASFMRFIGYYLSEGHIHYEDNLRGQRARVSICFNLHEQEYLKDLLEIYNRLGLACDTRENKATSTVAVTTSSRLLAFLLDRYLRCGKDSYSADIPDLIFSASKENKINLLRAMFRGDGHIAFPKNTNSVVYDFGSISYPLVHKSILLLLSLGIVPSYKTSISAKSTGPAHFFRVSTKKQIEQLPFFKDRKTQRKIDSVLKNCKDIKSVGFTRLNKDICLVGIKSLEREEKETFVYSVEVKGTENFVTSHGLIVHNCFPKDVKALAQTMERFGFTTELLRAVDYINERQKKSLLPKLKKLVPELDGKTIAVWGLAFKPRTDDVREATSITVIDQLQHEYAHVVAYDPEAMENARKVLKNIKFADNQYDCLKGADALIIVTEWDQFREPDFERMKSLMKSPIIIDGRNIYEPEDMKKLGFRYVGVGRGRL